MCECMWKLHGGGTTGRRSELARTESCLRVTEACLTAKTRPVCASDGLTYSSKCEIRRIRRCERTLLAVVSNGHCPIGKHHNNPSFPINEHCNYIAKFGWCRNELSVICLSSVSEWHACIRPVKLNHAVFEKTSLNATASQVFTARQHCLQCRAPY